MRLLFLSNFYPPVSRGGYELWCQEVAGKFRETGHDVVVLTSNFSKEKVNGNEPGWIHRSLYLEMEFKAFKNSLSFFVSRKRNQARNLLELRRVIENNKPDIVLIWGMWNLNYSLAELAEELLPNRVVYYLGDYWPVRPTQFENYWRLPAKNWTTAIPKFALKSIALNMIAREQKPHLKYPHVIYPTRFMRVELEKRGFFAMNSRIVYGGIDTRLYNGRVSQDTVESNKIRLLFVGRLSDEKGVHTAIEAVSRLVHKFQIDSLQLDIVGSGDPDYVTYLHSLAKTEGIQDNVNFLGDCEKNKLPDVYAQADLFLFTSIWPEPFGRVIVEAMASGVAVVATAAGGAAELLRDYENALVFKPGDADQLAEKIYVLIKSPDLKKRLADCGREFAQDHFDVEKMADGIEDYLEAILANR